MENFYEKLKTMRDENPKKLQTLQIVIGLICGAVCWLALRFSGTASSGGDGGNILTWVCIGFFALIMIGTNTLSRKAEINTGKFRIAFCISLGVCIAIFAVFQFILQIDGGLLKIIFPKVFLSV